MERTFYRITRGPAVAEEDFKSARQLAKPLRCPRFERQWSEGVSVYDTAKYAIRQTKLYRYRLGHFIVALTIPPKSLVEVETWETDPHHFTLYGTPAQLLQCVDGVPKRIDEEEPRDAADV